ncbi:MAG: FAD-dependent thymidylate synthase [Tenericutes bacterium]|jgi:thymidylate synthase ThyX|nr:FAD-dependent thymidylate synthase [Mycoplasmatota bacterium]
MKKAVDIKIELLPSLYLKTDGTFDYDKAKDTAGKFAGVCYDPEGFNHLKNEPIEKTNRRINLTLNNGHHSVYDHIMITLNIQNIPKILAMVINNEKQYTTSEKSARYTKVDQKDNSFISDEEIRLYNKWLNIFEQEITKVYGKDFGIAKIRKLAQENARYFITVFMPTEMIYTTSYRQINYIASWMKKYQNNYNIEDSFENKLAQSMDSFLQELDKLNILEEGLLQNEKNRNISLFKKSNNITKDYYGEVYNINYKASLAYIAQAMRHRTLDYEITILENKEYFIPPIIINNDKLIQEWLQDMHSIKDVVPQGELVLINEKGKYEDFILKCQERLCTSAQLEINNMTKEILINYKNDLVKNNHYLANDIIKYTKGARCTFPGFKCSDDCHFKEGKRLIRKV